MQAYKKCFTMYMKLDMRKLAHLLFILQHVKSPYQLKDAHRHVCVTRFLSNHTAKLTEYLFEIMLLLPRPNVSAAKLAKNLPQELTSSLHKRLLIGRRSHNSWFGKKLA